jgi:ribosome biogenesis GTPase
LENRYINYVQFQDMLANKKVRYKWWTMKWQ